MRNSKAPGDQIRPRLYVAGHFDTSRQLCSACLWRTLPSETVRCSLEVSERTLDERISLCPRKTCAAIFHFPLGRKVKIEQLIADMRVARKERKAVKCRVPTLKRQR